MRELALKNFWEKLGGQFGTLGSGQCAVSFGDERAEYAAIRESVALCDVSFAQIIEFSEAEGIDFLDTVLAANILKLRYGRIIDTFLASPDGKIAAEAFVANIDDKVFAVLESLDDGAAKPLIDGGGRDVSAEYVSLSVDGPKAREVAQDIFGADIFNLPFPSVEKYEFDSAPAYLMRCGKTGEFGYTFIVPTAKAEPMAQKLLESVGRFGGRVCGTAARAVAEMESGFFNVYAEGAEVGDPIALSLQWQADFSKESFAGFENISKSRADGAKSVITAVAGSGVAKGAKVYDGANEIGKVVCAAFSPSQNGNIGLALIDADCAYPSLELSSKPDGESDILTVSRPTVVSKSLSEQA